MAVATSETTSLAAVTALLGLRPASAADGAHVLGLVGGRGGPRFLLPLGHVDATTASCLAYLGLRDRRTRLNRMAVAAAMRAGAGRFVLQQRLVADTGPGSLLAHLADALGVDTFDVAVGLGELDEVWKPTLQAFGPDGTPLAYVKIGRGPIGARLATTELDTLRCWAAAEDPRLVVPALVEAAPWNQMPLVCTLPMPPDVRRLPPGPVSAWGVRTLDPPIEDRPIDDAPWWTARLERFAQDPEIAPLLERIAHRHRTGERAWARSHGDWVPWNLARSGRGLVAWDWEYSEAGAPVGIDETHLAFQVARVQHGRPIASALAAARAAAPSPWVADAHLAMLVTRAGDLARCGGRPVGDHHELIATAASILR